MKRVALIGCGNIGYELGEMIRESKDFTLVAVSDPDSAAVKHLLDSFKEKPEVVDLGTAVSKADIIVEAANKDVVRELLTIPSLDKEGKTLMVMSTSGIVENMEGINQLRHCEIHAPSGAIAGIDGIKAASGLIESLTLTTTKPPKGLVGAPYVVEQSIELDSLTDKTTVFKGSMQEAIKGFPKNVNVAATLFLASRFEGIIVHIVADPDATTNTHEICCKGDFGVIETRTENRPSKNPKTSYLAVLSAKRILQSLADHIHVG